MYYCGKIFNLGIYNIVTAENDLRFYEEIEKNREVNSKAIDTIAHYAEKLDTIQNDISEIKTDITIIMAKDN